MGQNNDDDIFRGFRARGNVLTASTDDVTEDSQVVQYEPGGHFLSHYDYIDATDLPGNEYYGNGGNRMITLLVYLNDVEEGGYTSFPGANPDYNKLPMSEKDNLGQSVCTNSSMKALNVGPKKGNAVIFYNLEEKGHMQGILDPATHHMGCDVVKGEKWIINHWIRNKRVNGKLYDNTR